MAVCRSHRQTPRITRLGVLEDSFEMEGEKESANTKTEDEYNLGEFWEHSPLMHFFGLG
jgi:hypothetical protein